MTSTFTLLSWGFAASFLLTLGVALALWEGPVLNRLSGSLSLKLSGLVTALFGWGAWASGGRESAPSAAAAFSVVAVYAFLMACVEIYLAAHLEGEEGAGQKSRPTTAHRARDYVKRYPEQIPIEASPSQGRPLSHGPTAPSVTPHLNPIRPSVPSSQPPFPKPQGLVGNDVSPREIFGTQADALRREMEARKNPPSSEGGNP